MNEDAAEVPAPGRVGASPAADISREMVRLMREYTGRGPTHVNTTVRSTFVLVLFEDTFTKGEQSLVAAGQHDAVRRQRGTFHTIMRDEAIRAVEASTGRRVRTMLSDVATEEGAAVLVFLLAEV